MEDRQPYSARPSTTAAGWEVLRRSEVCRVGMTEENARAAVSALNQEWAEGLDRKSQRDWIRDMLDDETYAVVGGRAEDIQALLDGSCRLVDSNDAWYFRCSHCGGTSQGVNLRSEADRADVTHKSSCLSMRLHVPHPP